MHPSTAQVCFAPATATYRINMRWDCSLASSALAKCSLSARTTASCIIMSPDDRCANTARKPAPLGATRRIKAGPLPGPLDAAAVAGSRAPLARAAGDVASVGVGRYCANMVSSTSTCARPAAGESRVNRPATPTRPHGERLSRCGNCSVGTRAVGGTGGLGEGLEGQPRASREARTGAGARGLGDGPVGQPWATAGAAGRALAAIAVGVVIPNELTPGSAIPSSVATCVTTTGAVMPGTDASNSGPDAAAAGMLLLPGTRGTGARASPPSRVGVSPPFAQPRGTSLGSDVAAVTVSAGTRAVATSDAAEAPGGIVSSGAGATPGLPPGTASAGKGAIPPTCTFAPVPESAVSAAVAGMGPCTAARRKLLCALRNDACISGDTGRPAMAADELPDARSRVTCWRRCSWPRAGIVPEAGASSGWTTGDAGNTRGAGLCSVAPTWDGSSAMHATGPAMRTALSVSLFMVLPAAAATTVAVTATVAALAVTEACCGPEWLNGATVNRSPPVLPPLETPAGAVGSLRACT